MNLDYDIYIINQESRIKNFFTTQQDSRIKFIILAYSYIDEKKKCISIRSSKRRI